MKVNWLALSAIIPTASVAAVGIFVFMSNLKAHVNVTQTQIISIKTNHAELRKDLRELRVEMNNIRVELRDLRSGLTRHYDSHVEHGRGKYNDHTQN